MSVHFPGANVNTSNPTQSPRQFIHKSEQIRTGNDNSKLQIETRIKYLLDRVKEIKEVIACLTSENDALQALLAQMLLQLGNQSGTGATTISGAIRKKPLDTARTTTVKLMPGNFIT